MEDIWKACGRFEQPEGSHAVLFRFSDKLQLIASSYLQQTIRILTVFVMARFIGPNDNGIFFLVLYTAGLVLALNDFAIPQGVVQIRDHSEDVVVDTALVLDGLLFIFYGLFAISAGIYLTHKDKVHDPQYWRIGVIYAIANFDRDLQRAIGSDQPATGIPR